jgi:hypothetical protein
LGEGLKPRMRKEPRDMSNQTGVRVEARFDCPIEKAWRLIGNFDLVPRVVPGTHDIEVRGLGIGAVRHVPFEQIYSDERLEELDEANHRLVYAVIEKSPEIPMQEYRAEMALTAEGPNACRFTWQSRFTLPDGLDRAAACAEVKRAYEISIAGFHAALADPAFR